MRALLLRVLGLAMGLAMGLASSAAVSQTPHELDIAWNDPAISDTPVIGYRVYFDDDGVPQLDGASVDVGMTHEYTFPGVFGGSSDDHYWVGVLSYDERDQRSEIVAIEIVVEFQTPAPPENVRALDIRAMPAAASVPAAVPTIRIEMPPSSTR